MRKGVNFVLGAVFGALVGASVAILMAPSSGDELRGEMQNRLYQFRDELQEAARQRRAELERQLKSLREPQASIPLEEK